jgi:hypothetical protein
MSRATKSAYGAAVAGGALLWLLAMGISGKAEAWDSPLYWAIAYPLAVCLAAGIGYLVPEKPWRWGLAVMLAQAVVMAMASSSYGLLPLGLILFAVLALPAIGLAQVTARIRVRKGVV